MFVPIALLAQQESMISTPEDVIQALDRWVLPKYVNFITDNPAFTKQECFGAIYSFQQAGKLHLRMKAEEVEKAVDAFLQDRLWVSEAEINSIVLNPNSYPSAWMLKPTVFLVMRSIPKVLWDAAAVIVEMVVTTIKYNYYRFKPARDFKVPSGAPRKTATNLTVLKKDS